MSPDRNFDELVGAEPTGSERERLRRTHELILRAGPLPELSPELEDGPRLDRQPGGRRRRAKRRGMLLLAAAVAVVAVFVGGYIVGDHGTTAPKAVRELALKGTSAAPSARADLEVLPAAAGNWPMKLTLTGLPKLPGHEYYEVYLVRRGERYLSCGTFVAPGGSGAVTVTLNAPYRLRPGDSWIVTRQSPHGGGHGATVLVRA